MPPFRRVHADDKALASEPIRRIMTWCPTMDLLAFVLGEGVINVHRLSWAKLISFEESSPVTALAWSPDGKTIASGHEDGSLHLVDAETGTAISSSKAHSSQVTSLSWAANTVRRKWICHASATVDELVSDRASSMLMPSDQQDTPQNSDQRTVLNKDRAINDVTVLLSGDASGVVSARMLGTFCLGQVQVTTPGGMCAPVTHLAITPDLSRVSILIQDLGEGKTSAPLPGIRVINSTGPSSTAGGYFCTFETSHLAKCTPLLVQVSSHAWQLECIQGTLLASLEAVKKLWKEARTHTQDRMDALEKCLVDHDSPGTAEGELLSGVATGSASAPLQSFLSHLRETGVRKWEKTVDTVCSSMLAQVMGVMLPAAQSLSYRACGLQGLARWKERYAGIGLEEDAIGDLVSVGGQVMAKGHELVAAAQKLQVGIGHFCKWLQKVALRLVSETGLASISAAEALLVSAFIKEDLMRDSITPLIDVLQPPSRQPAAPAPISFFFDAKALPQTPPPKGSGQGGVVGASNSPPPLPSGPKSTCALQRLLEEGNSDPAPSSSPLPLPKLLEHLKSCASRALKGPESTISDQMHFVCCVMAFTGSAQGSAPPPCALWSSSGGGDGSKDGVWEDEGFVLAQGTADSAVRLINIHTKDTAASTQVTRALLSVGAPGSVDDVSYYSPGSLCVAAGGRAGEQVMTDGEGGGGCIALLPLDDAEWSPVSSDAATQGWEHVDVQSTEGSQVRSLDASCPVRIAANGKRGVACCLLSEPWRVSLMDMEDEDEEDEGEEGEGEGEEEEGGDEAADMDMEDDGEQDMEEEDIE